MAKQIVADGFSFGQAEKISAEQKQRNAEKSRRCQQKKRQAGLCIRCSKPSNKTRCDECRKIHNENNKQLRDKRIETRKCEKCGGGNTTETTRCAGCQDRSNQQRSKRSVHILCWTKGKSKNTSLREVQKEMYFK